VSSIRVDGWRSSIRFDAAHLIPGHPKCGFLHGHTYALHAEVHGTPADSGFIMDFGDVKRVLRSIADDLDHQVLVQAKSPVAQLTTTEESVEMVVPGKRYVFPRGDVTLLPIEHTAAEHLVEHVADLLVERVDFPEGVSHVSVGLDESYGKGAWTTRRFR
jgi:6-pyruvoyltetrahydropterin/6-carboxytetrahydropterin synthase